jgi:fatty-acyl-CoA synthase
VLAAAGGVGQAALQICRWRGAEVIGAASEDVLGFVVLRPDARGTVGEHDLVEWCRAEMSVYKAPRAIRFVDALPKTASGKILKRALREQARAAT